MMSLNARATDSPEQSARRLLEQFGGDLVTIERHIVDEQLAAALREDDYDGYLHWRRIKSICAGLAEDQRVADAFVMDMPAEGGQTPGDLSSDRKRKRVEPAA